VEEAIISANINSDLEQRLATATSFGGIQQILSAEGVEMSEHEIVVGLLAGGVSPRFVNLSPNARNQVAQVLLLAERNPAIAQVLASPEQVGFLLPGLLAGEGLDLDDEAVVSLSQPIELEDQELEQVVGGFLTETLILGFANIVVGALATVACTWIVEHYKYKTATAHRA